MNTAERIARLEKLLARVIERRNAPRPARAVVPSGPATVPLPPARETSSAPSRFTSSPSSSAGDLPDLELIDTQTTTGHSSLVPSAAPAHAAQESARAPSSSSVQPPVVELPSIETEPVATEAPLEIEQTPLPGRLPRIEAPPAQQPISNAVRSSQVSPEAKVSAGGAPSVERFDARKLPQEPLIETVPMDAPPRPMTFRALLQRSLSLRARSS